MATILVPAGIIAALILFRWARTLALYALAAGVIWVMFHHAHAQKSTMVQCRTGHVVQMVPDYACDALLEGYGYLNIAGEKPVQNGSMDRLGVFACSKAMARHFEGGHSERFIQPCQQMWTQEGYARAQMR